MRLCVCVCVGGWVYARAYVCAHACIYPCIFVDMHRHACMYACAHTSTPCVHTHTRICPLWTYTRTHNSKHTCIANSSNALGNNIHSVHVSKKDQFLQRKNAFLARKRRDCFFVLVGAPAINFVRMCAFLCLKRPLLHRRNMKKDTTPTHTRPV
jgi:hypothetical protein